MRRFLRWARVTFISGLLTLLPLGLTAYLLWLLYRLAYALFGPHTAFAGLMRRLIGRYIPGTEVVITLLVVFLVGAAARHWLGRGLLRAVERVMLAVPGVRNLYWGARQLARVVLRPEHTSLQGRRMVVVEFPQPGSYVLGFVTNEDATVVSDLFTPDVVSVYIPTAPNPLSGWVLFVPRSKLAPASLTAEEALSIIISGGLVIRQPRSGGVPPDADLARERSE
ncbi:MAG TPA: DUF502 domain-containing protein [Candidatus Bipolaricaulis anaerobius]|jgi:uncharacterized membrane protein|nr:DUF502 domain-containing protein [Candidatus Bipolaricaulis anaerobius]HQM38148.1 DUF502 domain-containing protein [Candidatus Bipolaricaulis anaerobius]